MPRVKIRFLLPLLVVVAVVTYWQSSRLPLSFPQPAAPPQTGDKPVIGQLKTKNSHKFWRDVFATIGECSPKYDGERGKVIQFPENAQKGESRAALESKFDISATNVVAFKHSHDKIKKRLPKSLSDDVYKKDTQGIVLIGGGRFSWLSFLALINLRNLGSELPVELIIPSFRDYEREHDFCNSVLPQYNAKCVLVPDALGPEVMNRWEFKNYQFKSLALIVSSFQDVLLLDSDNYVLHNPDALMSSPLFKKYGMITWPDYWRRQINPQYYDIAGLKVNEKKRVRYNRLPIKHDPQAQANLDDVGIKNVPFHEKEGSIPDLSTESGQLAINKATHAQTLMLSLYYNMHGPGLYYKIFSSGQQGEGDKDTFVAAAEVMKQSYYQLKTFIRTMGYFNEAGNFEGVAMGQADPIEDYAKYMEVVKNPVAPGAGETINSPQIASGEKLLEDKFGSRIDKKLFAMHCNWPKYDPLDMMNDDRIYDQEKKRLKYAFFDKDFTYDKPTVKDGAKTFEKVRFELERWKEMRSVLCEQQITMAHFEKADVAEVCAFIKNQVEWLESK
ncbi:alpha-1,2-mannosyltransferase Mnn2p [Diutina catenulata]